MHKLIGLMLVFFMSANSQAEEIFEWTSNNIELLTGDGFELGSSYRSTITIEHADGWAYGENYIFVDIYQRDDVGVEGYGEWYPRLSMNKVFNKDFSLGLIKDFSIAAGINAGSEPSASPHLALLLGGGIHFNVPHAEFVQLDIMALKNDSHDEFGVQITPSWSIPFEVGSLNFKFRGFVDVVTASATGGRGYVLTQPQLLLDVGSLLGNKNSFYAGIEYWYWHNKFGVKGVNEQVAQAMLLYYF